MILRIDYLDNKIEIKSESITAIEVENKKYFYRIVNDFNLLISSQVIENIMFLDNEYNEINMKNKLKIFIDFFNWGFDSKKYLNDISKYINDNLLEEDKLLLSKQYIKIKGIYKKILNDIDIPLSLDDDISLDNLIKLLNVRINQKDNLLDNLFLIIDLEKLFNKDNILIFVNLKQYLSKDEVNEFYKYCIYNQVKILLIDSQSYGVTLNNEIKLIIDENLDEFVL